MKQICFLLIPMVVFISSLNAQASFNDLNVCGKSRLAMNRIVGGSTARQGEFPWQVALMRRGRTLPICGGTLISDKWIITAAHCLRDLSTLEGVVLGAHAFGFNVNEATREERNIVFNDIKVHPDYNPATFHNDIALIPMNRPVQYTSNIRPACLVDVAPPAGSEVVISGWGTISAGGPQSAILKDTKVNIVSRERCQASFEDAIITQNMMCAAASGTDACQGDSGGPMVLNQRDANGIDQFYLAGIISWGRGCARPDFPGVYTNVANLREWIDEIVNADQEATIETPEVTEPSETIDTTEDVVPFFQFFSQRNRDHFYTYNQREATRRYRLKRNNNVVCRILRRALPEGTRPLYRYFDGSHRRRSRTLNDHFMTTNEAETRSTEFRSYRRRSIAGYCFTSQKSDTLPLHRYHLKTGNVRDHYYTTEENGPQGYTLDDFTDPCYVYPA